MTLAPTPEPQLYPMFDTIAKHWIPPSQNCLACARLLRSQMAQGRFLWITRSELDGTDIKATESNVRNARLELPFEEPFIFIIEEQALLCCDCYNEQMTELRLILGL